MFWIFVLLLNIKDGIRHDLFPRMQACRWSTYSASASVVGESVVGEPLFECGRVAIACAAGVPPRTE